METGFHTLILYYHNCFNFTIYFVFCEYLFYLREHGAIKEFKSIHFAYKMIVGASI